MPFPFFTNIQRETVNSINNTSSGVPYPNAAPEFVKESFNIKSSYPWTLNNNLTLRNYVPTLYLNEYKLTRSGELQSLQNTLLGVAESDVATGVLGAAVGGTFLNFLRSLVPARSSVGRALNQPAAGVLAATGGAAAALGIKEAVAKDAILNPYKGLYPAEPTGNTYILPYLNVENMTEAAGSWRSVDDTNISSKIGAVAGGAAGTLGDLKEAATKLVGITGGMYRGLQTLSQLDLALTNPGTAQEKIKAFTPNDTGDSINLSFYLYNTTDDVTYLRKNWDFLFKLTYQNLPNRKSINVIDPPCVYEVEVPGYKRFPIAVIESFKVSNEGTTRLVNLDTGEITENANGNNIKIIPEAYKVTLKITSLLTNTRNLYYYMNNQSQNRVNVFQKSRVFGS